MTSQPSSLLFDKGVVRRVYEAQFQRSQGRLPTPLQMEAVEVFARLRSPDKRLYIIVTGDLKLVTNFNTRSAEIKARFDQMILNLPAPYHSLSLPEMVTPATVLTDW